MSKTAFAAEKRVVVPGKITAYLPQGKLNGHQECFDWLEGIRSDVQSGAKCVVIDLSGVERIDSTGVGILASIHVSAVNAGGKLCLYGLDARQRALLEATWLSRVIPSFEDEKAAVAACG
jgi:anti-anti-sigma factor